MKRTKVQTAAIQLVSESRRSLLVLLKKKGWATIPQLAESLSISTEAVRQQLWQLEKEGWVVSDCGPEEESEARTRGRPPAEYCLSPSGEDLFPKNYSQLAMTLFDSLRNPVEVLTAFTDDRVHVLQESTSSSSLAERMNALRSIYVPDDPYTDVEKSEHGYRLVERNCPFLNFAIERPLFCSTTVSTLRRLTGCEVVREKRFQDGDGQCVFHVYADRPLSNRRREIGFEIEPAKQTKE